MKKIIFLIITIPYCLFGIDPIHAETSTSSWAETQKNGKGDIVFYFRETEPFIILGDEGDLSGVEYDLIQDFQRFVEQYYGYQLNVIWERKERFSMVYDAIKSEQKNGTFAISIISNTEERQKEVKFSPSYMFDISVLVSSKNVQTVNRIEEFKKVFNGLSAVTMSETTHEQQLNKIRNEYENNFPIIYTENTDNVLEAISNNDNYFGFVDLPSYLIASGDQMNIKLQNVFSFKEIGYGFTYSLNSDWDEPIQAYFNNPNFNPFMRKTIEKYLGTEIYEFIETLSDSENESLVLLAREKEIQIKERELILREQRAARNLFLGGFLAMMIVFLILYSRYEVKVEANEALDTHKKKIEKQRKSIKIKNEKLETTNSELVSLNQEKNNLINILSHDLRAPANNIQGLVTVYQMSNKDLTEEQAKIINHMKSEAQRLNLMIEKILDIRCIEEKRINIHLEKFNLVELSQEVVDSFSDRANVKNIVLDFSSNEELVHIKADGIYLRQVLENLISNAIKFSNQQTTIRVKILNVDEKARLEVVDEGPGIDEEDMKKMFNKFQRLSAKPTGGESSTGLGLSIVKKLIEEMNGEVWCESEVDKGSSFIIEFDLVSKSKICFDENNRKILRKYRAVQDHLL